MRRDREGGREGENAGTGSLCCSQLRNMAAVPASLALVTLTLTLGGTKHTNGAIKMFPRNASEHISENKLYVDRWSHLLPSLF